MRNPPEIIPPYRDFSDEIRRLVSPEVFHSAWDERHWLNVPGPFYGAMTDTCLCGPLSAPKNILFTDEGQEFVFRQPNDAEEFLDVLWAAYRDPCQGYGADGNRNWTPKSVREWWSHRGDVLAWIAKARGQYMSDFGPHHPDLSEALDLFESFMKGEAEVYLASYLEFLKSGRYPLASDSLPPLR